MMHNTVKVINYNACDKCTQDVKIENKKYYSSTQVKYSNNTYINEEIDIASNKIEVIFFGTSYSVSDRHGEKVKIGNKTYPNIRMKQSGDTTKYRFSGPNILDLGSTNVANNIKNGISLMSHEIDNWLSKNLDCSENLQITITGYSRGGVAATRVADELRKKCNKNGKIKIALRAADPYAGPTHTGKDTLIDLKPNKPDNNQKDIIFYSIGTTLPCSPQQVMNADIVVICAAGHNDTTKLMCEYGKFYAKKEDGVYLLPSSAVAVIKRGKDTSPISENKLKEVVQESIKITKNNLKFVMDTIYKWKYNYRERTRVLTEVIIKKLNLKIDDVLETGAVQEWKPNLQKNLGQIKKSLTLRAAFNYVTELFSDKLFGPYIDKNGKFFERFQFARSAVVGIGNNNYNEALGHLNSIIEDSHQGYKKAIAASLKERICRYYKIKPYKTKN